MCTGEDLERDEVLGLLSYLVDKSLVVAREEGGEARYRLLETVRQYGREKLSEPGEEAEVRGRHAGYYLGLAEEAEPELKAGGAGSVAGRGWRRSTTTCGRRYAGCSERRRVGGGRAAGWRAVAFWGLRGSLRARDGGGWRGVIARSVAPPCRRPPGRRLCTSRAWWPNLSRRPRVGEPLLEESLGLFRELEDKQGIASALSNARLCGARPGATYQRA